MIQTKIQFNLTNAREYFKEHLAAGDYYSEGEKVIGNWLGFGADKLGLKGPVSERKFLALCEGKHPETGLRLGQRLNSIRKESNGTKANRRIFFDFTIAPPKSVSIVALIKDNRIVDVHERAVRLAMLELEKRAEARIRKGGQNGERTTGNIVMASFQHDTSRELDPQLHTHCVVMNATFDGTETRWKALHPAGMYRAHRFATSLYRHELSRGLRQLGYEIENHARGFEIRGISRSLIDRFSKRHRQIDQETQERVGKGGRFRNVNDLREQIAHGKRRPKMKNSTAERLQEAWRKEMSPSDYAVLSSLSAGKLHEDAKIDLAAILTWADQHLFERRSVIHEHELMATALDRGRGKEFELKSLQQAVAQRGYLREKGTDKLTSKEVLGLELEVVASAHDGRNRYLALNPIHQCSAALSYEQTVAVQRILRSRDFITLFQGGAGTGKSFTLKEVERGLLAAKLAVLVLAPQRQQVQDLQSDGLAAETLSQFLQKKQLARDTVVIVDEAGQIGARQLAELIRAVKASNGRLILSGDTRQHGAVAASDALRAIEKHSGLKPAVIRAIRRQNPKLGESPQQRSFIRGYRNAVKGAATGKVVASFDALDRLGCIREVAPEKRCDALAQEYLAALERKDKVLVVGQTREEVRTVNEAIRAEMLKCGKLGSGRLVTTYQPVDLDEAQKKDARYYQAGNFVYFLRGYGRFAKGDLCTVVAANERGIVIEKGDVQSTISYHYSDRISIAAARDTEIAPGDRLQLKFNGRSAEGIRLNNGELVTVREVLADGAIRVQGGAGECKTLGPTQRLLVRGYAVTSYGSQGKTVDTVLLADSGNRAATDAHQWYVSISRGRKRVVVFTDDKPTLRSHVQQAGDRELAMDLKRASGAPVDVRPTEYARRSQVVSERIRQDREFARTRAAQIHHQEIRL